MSLNLLHDVSSGKNVPHEITVVVEINKGSKNKYELDKETGLILLDRVMHTSQDYPFDYGFVPQSHWHDGDPLDVVLLTTYPLLPGILVHARPVGVIDMVDSGEGDAKILAVPLEDPRFKHVEDIDDVNPHILREIEHFFLTYKTIQNKVVTISSVRDAKSARDVIKEATDLYKKKTKGKTKIKKAGKKTAKRA
ncbi:MAG: inorganic pyrophosphatase [Patescibacteria group bacterium]|nr:inorganic pyrophosphatase [Patescibacteria group bacterium]